MSVTLRLIFRGIEPSDALEDYVRFHAADLVGEHAHIEGIDVIIDAANECGVGGGRFRASVKSTGAVFDGLTRAAAYEHPCAAIDAAFGEARELLDARQAEVRAARLRTTKRVPAARRAG